MNMKKIGIIILVIIIMTLGVAVAYSSSFQAGLRTRVTGRYAGGKYEVVLQEDGQFYLAYAGKRVIDTTFTCSQDDNKIVIKPDKDWFVSTNLNDHIRLTALNDRLIVLEADTYSQGKQLIPLMIR